MPALAPVTGVARVVCHGTANGNSVVNVFHINNGPGAGIAYTQTGINSLATSIAGLYRTRFMPLMNALYSGDEVTATDLSSPTGVVGTAVITTASGASGATIPASAACCVTWKILRHYRGGHPRTYIGPLGTAAFESPTSLASTFVTSMQSAASGFMSDVAALTIEARTQKLVCVHRQVDGVQLATPLVDTIIAAAIDSRIDSMRRRLGPDR